MHWARLQSGAMPVKMVRAPAASCKNEDQLLDDGAFSRPIVAS